MKVGGVRRKQPELLSRGERSARFSTFEKTNEEKADGRGRLIKLRHSPCAGSSGMTGTLGLLTACSLVNYQNAELTSDQ